MCCQSKAMQMRCEMLYSIKARLKLMDHGCDGWLTVGQIFIKSFLLQGVKQEKISFFIYVKPTDYCLFFNKGQGALFNGSYKNAATTDMINIVCQINID